MLFVEGVRRRCGIAIVVAELGESSGVVQYSYAEDGED